MFSSNSINRNAVGAAIAGAVSLGCGCKAVSSIAQGLYNHWSLQNDVLQRVQSFVRQDPLMKHLPIPRTFSAAKAIIKSDPSIFSGSHFRWFRATYNSMLIEGAVFSGLAVATAFLAYKLFKRNTPAVPLAPSLNNNNAAPNNNNAV